MFILDVSARKINLRGPTQDTLVSDSLNVYPCRFFFTHDWDGLVKTAVFKSGDVTKEIILDETNSCEIPWETLVKHNQDLFVGCYGIRYKTVEPPTGDDDNGEEEGNGENIGEEIEGGIETLSEDGEDLGDNTEPNNPENPELEPDNPDEPTEPDEPAEDDIIVKSELILNTIWKNIGRIHEGTKNVDNGVPEPPTPSIYEQLLGKIGNLEELKTKHKSDLVSAINEVYCRSCNGNVDPDGPMPSIYVKSFNGRTGSVIPRKGDYTAEMVGAVSQEDYDNFQEDFNDFVESIQSDLTEKVDKTGGTVTGPITFSDTTTNSATPVMMKATRETVTGTTINAEGLYKNSQSPLNIQTSYGVVDFDNGDSTTILMGVQGDETIPSSVPNMEQLETAKETIKESIREDIPTKTSDLVNDSNFATEEYVQDTLGSIDIGGDGVVSDHRLLQHRDAENQHPISAITNLQDALDKIPTAMTADQLRKILIEGEN